MFKNSQRKYETHVEFPTLRLRLMHTQSALCVQVIQANIHENALVIHGDVGYGGYSALQSNSNGTR
jgi:hypothetical protein